MASNTNIDSYNSFCKSLEEGSILYNMDKGNGWGEYLLVVNKSTLHVNNIRTYCLILLGLKKEEGVYKPRNLKISFTPDYAESVPFLKYVGYCKFELWAVIKETDVNVGLVASYGSTDLHKYTQKLSIRKPQKRKYDKYGNLIIKKLNND